MSTTRSATSLARPCLRRGRKRSARSGMRITSRLSAVLAVAVMVLGVTAAQAKANANPSMILNGTDVDIAVQPSNDSLMFYWAEIGTGTWHAETVAGPRTTFSAPSMILDGNAVNIAILGPDDDLLFYWKTNGTGTWHPETIAGTDSAFY